MKIISRVAEMERERYQSSGDYSVTDIITPVRIVRLKKRYADQVPLDPESMIASMTGTAVHEYIEKYLRLWIAKHGYTDYILEEQLAIDVDVILGGEILTRKVSGRYDIRDGSHLYDIKNIKTWKLIFDPNLDEFHEQQNLYSYLLHTQGIELDTINITAFYKDWQEGSALRDKNYPQSQVVEYQLTKWDHAYTVDFLEEKLTAHVAHEETPDDELPICTRKERWERHQGGESIHYGILKNKKAKRATKVVRGGTLDEAIKIANGLPKMTKDS
jgi:hypothetical protein